MDEIERNKAIARQYSQSVMDGDIAGMDRLQHRDCSWWVLGGGTMTRETFMGLVAAMVARATSRSVTLKGMTAEGDRVAIELEAEMVFPDRTYRNSYHNLLVIRDGLIVEGKEYMDTAAAAAAFA